MHHSSDGAFAIRARDWKLMRDQGAGDGNDTKIAPEAAGERVNLYRRHPEIVARLAGLLKRYQDEGRSNGRGM